MCSGQGVRGSRNVVGSTEVRSGTYLQREDN